MSYLPDFPHEPIPEGIAESELIVAAQGGDPEAMACLIRAYVPGLVSLIAEYVPVLGREGEDVAQEVLAEFMAYVHGLDVAERAVCSGFKQSVRRRLDELAAARNGFGGIHYRTLSWYSRLMREADYDVDRAADLVESLATRQQISRAQVYAVHAAVTGTYPLVPSDDDRYDEATDSELLAVEYATLHECVDRLPSDERAVVRWAYGFEAPRPMTDAEVAEEWSRAVLPEEVFDSGARLASRATVQRKRVRALDTLREDFVAAINGFPAGSCTSTTREKMGA